MPDAPVKSVVVSVLIPSYNMATFLPNAVRSVLSSSFGDVEVLIVDDGSTDATPNVAARFTNPESAWYDARVRYLRQRNSGKPAALNRALGEMRGAYATILDADDELTPHSLGTRYAETGGEPHSQRLIVGGFEVFDGEAVLGVRSAPALADAQALRRRFWLSHKTPFHLNACLIPVPLLRRTGPFDTRLRRCQDIDYSMRLLEQADEVKRIDEAVYRYRKHRSSARSRLTYRLRTARHRPVVLWKNCHGASKVVAVLAGLALDIAKAAYELVSNYEQ